MVFLSFFSAENEEISSCKLLDTTAGIGGSQSIAELRVMFQAKVCKLRDAGILLQRQTQTKPVGTSTSLN